MKEYIYIIKANPDSTYKIGRTTNVQARISTIQTGNHNDIKIVETFEFSKCSMLENIIHRKYKPYKLRGEWFNFTDDILEQLIKFIKDMIVELSCEQKQKQKQNKQLLSNKSHMQNVTAKSLDKTTFEEIEEAIEGEFEEEGNGKFIENITNDTDENIINNIKNNDSDCLCKYCKSFYKSKYTLAKHLKICKEIPKYEERLETEIRLLHNTLENKNFIINKQTNDISNLREKILKLENHIYNDKNDFKELAKTVIIKPKT
jgi:hypothetical protein